MAEEDGGADIAWRELAQDRDPEWDTQRNKKSKTLTDHVIKQADTQTYHVTNTQSSIRNCERVRFGKFSPKKDGK